MSHRDSQPSSSVLRLHDSRTRAKRVFLPLDASDVRVYSCGPTVHGRAHIGNARAALNADLMARVLRRFFPNVRLVRNVTDIDDKILARAAAEGRPWDAIARESESAWRSDTAALGLLEPDVQPRATEHIPEMLALVGLLIENGHAYAAEGHVLFDVRSNPRAGSLSGHSLEDLRAGARVETAPFKRDPADFVLWKPSLPGHPSWDSPWGAGRPGWHIECSAMAARHLGSAFDVHMGGSDLLFPHHENEEAQTTCAFKTERMAEFWHHTGMVTVAGRKMSKSAGNTVSLGDLLDGGVPPMAVRLHLMSAHPRQPLDHTDGRLAQSRAALRRFSAAAARAGIGGSDAWILDALSDDLNLPEAIARLHALAGRAEDGDAAAAADLAAGLRLLGIVPSVGALDSGVPEGVAALAARREAARKAKDYAGADALRAEILALGWKVSDGSEGAVLSPS